MAHLKFASIFKCDFCGKKFRFDSCLTDHRRLHTGKDIEVVHSQYLSSRWFFLLLGERPYVCSECPSAYANYSNYSKHMRGRHGIDPKKHKNESSQLIDNGIEKFEIFSTASTMHKYWRVKWWDSCHLLIFSWRYLIFPSFRYFLKSFLSHFFKFSFISS